MLNVNSALNRINVRRLLIAMRNRISQILSSYLFENNTSENRLRAEALVRQYLESLRLRGAVTDYEVAIDSVTTPTDIDNNTLRARVTVQPARSIEYIDITFVITPTGVEIT
jgi:phage tail sheath protein FI